MKAWHAVGVGLLLAGSLLGLYFSCADSQQAAQEAARFETNIEALDKSIEALDKGIEYLQAETQRVQGETAKLRAWTIEVEADGYKLFGIEYCQRIWARDPTYRFRNQTVARHCEPARPAGGR